VFYVMFGDNKLSDTGKLDGVTKILLNTVKVFRDRSKEMRETL
jgi:hypothetical protein